MARLIFEEPFEGKLKKHRIKQCFSFNIKDTSVRYGLSLDKIMDELKYNNWRSFIESAFIWEDTPEGHEYWDYISKLE